MTKDEGNEADGRFFNDLIHIDSRIPFVLFCKLCKKRGIKVNRHEVRKELQQRIRKWQVLLKQTSL